MPYILTIDGQLFNGETTDQGEVEFSVPPDAKEAIMTIPETGERFDLGAGHMDPIDTDSGVALRLSNLGYPVESGSEGPDPDSLSAAVRAFQARNSLEETGEIDDTTRDKIKEVAGY